MIKPLSVLVVGCGHMGSSHAAAYHEIDDFEMVGLVSRGSQSREALNHKLGGNYSVFSDFKQALEITRPDVVSINTYPNTHEEYAIQAFASGSHVFLEKPVALTIEGCRRVINAAKAARRKLVVGYILRHHPFWMKLIEAAGHLGKPLVMRFNLNRQSSGGMWDRHKKLMISTSPIVDSGVHYVDIMCQMTGANPVRVSAVGARLTDEIEEGIHNYGQLHVAFDDGSVGWYEAGWGPMMSETGLSLKDVIGPKGSASITAKAPCTDAGVESLRIHHSEVNDRNMFVHKDDVTDFGDEPDHKDLCKREQLYFLKAIREDLDLTDHGNMAVNSLRIVLAADESIKTGNTVLLR